MSLSYAIEYLLTLERPGGGRLVHGGGNQLIIPIFPPATTITITSAPFGNDFAYISFLAAFGPALVPGAFYAWGQQWGSRTYDGNLASWLINNELDCFAVITQSEPSTAQIANQSPLNQYYEGIGFFIAIPSEEDYHLVLEALKRLGTSAQLEELGRQANAMLSKLTGGLPSPEPPFGGS
jgi:hypothetical protein